MEALFDRFKHEHPDPVTCPIRGLIPDWLKGTLYRNGSGLYNIDKDKFNHLFDGMAVLHKYSIKSSGNIEYCNRLIRSRTYKRNKRANRIVVTEFGTSGCPDPTISICTRYFWFYYDQIMTETDNTSVNIFEINREFLALTETDCVNLIEPVSLETKQNINLGDYINLRVATPHPLKDSDGNVWNFGTHISCSSHYALFKIPANTAFSKSDSDPFANLEVICRIPARWSMEPSYYHSFGMSKNYVVFLEQTLTLPPSVFISLLQSKPVSDALKFYANEKCIFHIVDKRSGKLLNIRFTADVFFSFHFVNVFEDDGHLVVDLCCYPDAEIFKYFRRPDPSARSVNDKDTCRVWRFVLPLDLIKSGKNGDEDLVSLDYTTATAVRQATDDSVFCCPEVISECILEMPQINHAFDGHKYRYCYGIRSGKEKVMIETSELLKFDFLTRKATIWFDENYVPSEPLFVPAPNAKAEDDGILLSPLFNKCSDQPPALLILNASTFTEIARAEIPPDVQVPYTFHGTFSNVIY